MCTFNSPIQMHPQMAPQFQQPPMQQMPQMAPQQFPVGDQQQMYPNNAPFMQQQMGQQKAQPIAPLPGQPGQVQPGQPQQLPGQQGMMPMQQQQAQKFPPQGQVQPQQFPYQQTLPQQHAQVWFLPSPANTPTHPTATHDAPPAQRHGRAGCNASANTVRPPANAAANAGTAYDARHTNDSAACTARASPGTGAGAGAGADATEVC